MKTLMLGEIRRIGIEVYSTLGSDFEIESATYEVINSSQEIIDTGTPRIEGKKITMLFNTAEYGMGLYSVVFTYNIKDETIKSRVLVGVAK